jgi:hypothetical protein
VTQAVEAAAAAEAAHVLVVLSTKASAQVATTIQDSAALHVKDEEDRATLAEREAWERVSRMEVSNATVLASLREEHRARQLAE